MYFHELGCEFSNSQWILTSCESFPVLCLFHTKLLELEYSHFAALNESSIQATVINGEILDKGLVGTLQHQDQDGTSWIHWSISASLKCGQLDIMCPLVWCSMRHAVPTMKSACPKFKPEPNEADGNNFQFTRNRGLEDQDKQHHKGVTGRSRVWNILQDSEKLSSNQLIRKIRMDYSRCQDEKGLKKYRKQT